jgi:hypothetical protein
METAANDPAIATFRRGRLIDMKRLRVEVAGEGEDLRLRHYPPAAIDDFTDHKVLKITHLRTPYLYRRSLMQAAQQSN